ncbi:hypothetical protein [Zavarzinella formosa]|uniref:hypothetical protein n=1 Tax=Zavarzinella formosa TaxID=360055 RepID=UPI00030C8739|nr:hypothetical protein [Zavarzinella formosa]
MSRGVSVDNLAAMEADCVCPVIFVKLELDSGDILVHSRTGDITWGGDTYLGMGQFGEIGLVREDTELGRNPVDLTLSGIDEALISVLLGEYYQGREATVYIGFLDLVTFQLVDTPEYLYGGMIDNSTITRDQNATITLRVENEEARWDTPNVRRFNNADQQLRYPGDKGLEYMEQMAEKQLNWGRG